MQRVLGHTPAWLSDSGLFQPAPSTKAPAAALSNGGKKIEHRGPARTVAHRGTEVFVVVSADIRWSDLVALRDGAAAAYRTLKTPVAGQIRQLVVSPHGDYLAILTSHTVHVAVLPDSTHLTAHDSSPLRLKTFQLGPTAHVVEQAPVVSALWHPLGHTGSCLVTVTADACVRLWELNRDSRASFDEPALALDLKKLGNATSSDEDFRASKYGTSKAFSPDSVEMEVAAACFGGHASSDEHGWATMTLWVAMTEGDVYALCPLLPSKWAPTATTIPSLTTAVVAKAAAIRHDEASETERRIVDQQQRWLADIDAQEPLQISHADTFATVEVYNRPASPPAIPKLQGPFLLSPEPAFDNITDIFVIGPRVDDDALMQEEDQDDFLGHEGLSVGVVCLATASAKVHVCLDLDGVEAQWLPSRRAAFRNRFDLQDNFSELLLVETLTTTDTSTSWPTFTPSSTSRYGFFLSLDEGLFTVSLDSWISHLEDELIDPTDSGVAFRLDVLFDAERTSIQQILTRDLANTLPEGSHAPACISFVDSDLGHFVLTSTSTQPQAVILDLPVERSLYTSFAPDDVPLALPAPAVRQPYQPSDVFFAASTLPSFLESVSQLPESRLNRADLKNQVRFSPATLQLLTDAHRILSAETSRLGAAAADLFRRCERMRAELAEQIRKVDDVAKRAEAVTGDDERSQDKDKDEDEKRVGGKEKAEARVVGKEKVEARMQQARTRSKELAKRVEAMRRKMAGLGGKELSAKEQAWAAEVSTLSVNLGEVEATQEGETAAETLTARLQAVSELQNELIARAKEAAEQQKSNPPDTEDELDLGASTNRVPADFRKQKIQQVMSMLEREAALVDAVTDRLERLRGLGSWSPSL